MCGGSGLEERYHRYYGELAIGLLPEVSSSQTVPKYLRLPERCCERKIIIDCSFMCTLNREISLEVPSSHLRSIFCSFASISFMIFKQCAQMHNYFFSGVQFNMRHRQTYILYE